WRELPTGLSAANQTKKAQVPPRRSAAQGAFGALSGWPVYYGLPQGAATPEGYRAYKASFACRSYAPAP
ncbi:MAG TPA: hypothetical protein VKP61_15605, partial [Candidatus Acidoferrum sp.]|nr:hypothetical protein [Candidatus Acidoferrum sp.]